MKEEPLELSGVVIDKQPNAFFKVQINDTEHIVLATLSGRMRRNRIRILMGDRVDIELSPYDLTKGRITYRHK
jgi:translation initiation factor IF-1